MNIILIMIPLSLLVLIGAAAMFFWAVNKGQFDDLDSPSLAPLEDNLPDEENEENDEGQTQDPHAQEPPVQEKNTDSRE